MSTRDLVQLRRFLSDRRWHRTRPSPGPSARPLVGSAYPDVFGKGILAASRFRVWQWDRALERLKETQEKQLLRIVRHAQDSEFGREHGLASVTDLASYQRNVPVGDYDSYEARFQRIRKGEQNVLVPDRIRFICNSAGSSQKGRQKYLPVSDKQVRFQQGSAGDAVHRYLAWSGDDTFTSGFVLSVFPPTVMRREGDVLLTNNPSMMMTKLPLFSEPVYLPDRDTMAIDDIDGKLDAIADKYLDHDVRTVTGTTCWFSILFDKLLRAAQRKGRSVSTVAEVWPNLRFLVGGGVAADPYIPVIQDRMGRDDVALIDTYNATEGGIFAITDRPGEPGLRMVPDRGVFFELVPLEEADSDSPRRLPLWEVEPERDYVIHVTNISGLFSYRLGDIVRFSDLWPHRMEFSGRLSGCLSTTQELTTHIEVQKAMQAALSAEPAKTVDYAVGADVGVNGTAKARYVVFAEFVPGHEPADRGRFLDAFDAAHIQQNRAYREHRTADTAILAPELVALPPGSVARFMADEGMTSVQTKFPRIVDEARRDRLRSYARA
ncbi:MAG: GH3 auxin-responsive promoter family protein [Sandaracinaceae bacterium]